MKPLITLAALCLFSLFGCKKESSTKSIQIQITVPANTSYNLSVNDGNSTIFGVSNGTGNISHILTPKSGDNLVVIYGFVTGSQQFGQGVVTFTYNSQTLLTINGGNGTQNFIVP